MRATDGFSKASCGVYTDFQEAVEKQFCSSHAGLEQLLALQQEGLGKSVKILKHFARGKIKLVN
jgi:hypothetical protein